MALSDIPSLTAHSRVVASRDQLSTSLSGEAVILGLSDSVYYGLDGVGAFIWPRLQTPVTLADVAEAITRQFDVGVEDATRDLLSLADDLLSRGLLERVPDAAS